MTTGWLVNTSSIWNRQAGCSGFKAGPVRSWAVGAGGIGRFCNKECNNRIPEPFDALVKIIGTIELRLSASRILSTTFRTVSWLLVEIFPSSDSRIDLVWSGGRTDGILPAAFTAVRIFERVCFRLLDAKSNFVITIARGLSNFRQSSRWASARSIPTPA